jgi:hypothetical protein
MSLFNPTKTCVFSAVKARLTKNGEPLRNVTVIRRWEWKAAHEDSATTDTNGNLKFPAVYESSLTRLTPMELVIAQSLHAKVDGEEFMFWVNTKFDPKENAEFKGRPTVLTCDLSKEMKTTREFGSIMYTLCTWE